MRQISKKYILSLILIIIALLYEYQVHEEEAIDQGSSKNYYVVTKVSDGDTFWVEKEDGAKEKVRLIGIDAPESRNTGQKKIGYFGKEAKNYLTKYLLNKKVRLETDVRPRDRYNRLLAYVYLENGTFLNAHLVKNGYAMVYTVPPNVKHADYFVKLQQEARKNKRGLWNK
jgi:micrococcal nuclease